jgi:hypothetical protein
MPSDAEIPPLRSLLQELLAACGGSEATYWEERAEAGELVALVNAGPDPARLEGVRVPIDGSLVGMVLCSGMAMALGPDAAYHPAAQEATGVLTEAMAAAPVRVQGLTTGVLSTINPKGKALFGQGDLDQLQRQALRLGRLLEGGGHDA